MPVSVNVMLRRSAGDTLRLSNPALISRSQARLALDGFTPRASATAPRPSGPRVSINTRMRNCGTVIASSTAAIEDAAIPTSTREARRTASTWPPRSVSRP